jgi:hypothetical protein
MITSSQTKPGLFMIIALMTLVNGIFNIIWGVSMIQYTAGFLLVCFPIAPFPIILGGFEIAYAIKLLANPPQPVQPSQAIAIWEIVAVLVGNVFSLVVGILALIFYNDQVVKEYFAQLNRTQTPPPSDPIPAPTLPVDSIPAPSAPEEPAQPEAPAAPKRRPRKVT